MGINKSAHGNKRSDATAIETTRRAKTKEAQAVWQRKGMRATITSHKVSVLWKMADFPPFYLRGFNILTPDTLY